MSLVEVSPSTETMLKVLATSCFRAFSSMAGAMAQSVVRNTSMVARSGWIMPEPLAMPPSLQGLPSTSKATAISLTLVSVVMMASAASRLWSPKAAASWGMAAAMGATSSFWPMTPVEATTTFSGAMPSAAPARQHISWATWMPSALQVLALPLLQMMAWAMPS